MPATVKINYWDRVLDGRSSHFSVLIPAIPGDIHEPAKPERYISLYKKIPGGAVEMDLTASADLITVTSKLLSIQTKMSNLDKEKLCSFKPSTLFPPTRTYELKNLNVMAMHLAFEKLFDLKGAADDQSNVNPNHLQHLAWSHFGNYAANMPCCTSRCDNNHHNDISICFEVLKAGGLYPTTSQIYSNVRLAKLGLVAASILILLGIGFHIPRIISNNSRYSSSAIAGFYARDAFYPEPVELARTGLVFCIIGMFLIGGIGVFTYQYGASANHIVRKKAFLAVLDEAYIRERRESIALRDKDERIALIVDDPTPQRRNPSKSRTDSRSASPEQAASSHSFASTTSRPLSEPPPVPAAKSAEPQGIRYSDLQFLDAPPLGQGGFGIVRKAIWSFTPVAVKVLQTIRLSENALTEFRAEVERHSALRHPNIVTLYGACLETAKYSMVMELMLGGSLYALLHNDQTLPWALRLSMAKDIAAGLAYLHSLKIIHRDLKSLNVLLDDRGRAKLTDFGLSRVKLESVATKTVKAAGTIRWMAPELFERRSQYNERSDIYAMGMVFWELSSRALPFRDSKEDVVVTQWIVKGEREDIPTETPPAFSQLISRCWAQRAQDRPAQVREIIPVIDEAAASLESEPERKTSEYQLFSR